VAKNTSERGVDGGGKKISLAAALSGGFGAPVADKNIGILLQHKGE
jgi:gamma-glutamyltranspeptidase